MDWLNIIKYVSITETWTWLEQRISPSVFSGVKYGASFYYMNWLFDTSQLLEVTKYFTSLPFVKIDRNDFLIIRFVNI